MDDRDMPHASELLDELTVEAWQTFLETDLVRTGAGELDDDALYASVAIIGPSTSTIVIACDAVLAASCSAQVLQMTADELTPEDVNDVLGELANIVAGNLKGAWGGDGDHYTLSLPVVSAAEQWIHGSSLTARSAFECDGATVVCELREPA